MNDSEPNAQATQPENADPATGQDSPEELKARLEAAEARAAENWDRFLRATAELENVRRRAEREALNAQKYGLERLLADLLLIADSTELGLKAASAEGAEVKALVEGLQLTHRQLTALLEKNGVRPIDPQGEPFNPDLHEAVSMLESAEVAPNHVLSVMQKGYWLHDRVLRPAMVVVARAPAASGGASLNEGGASPDSKQD